MRKPAAKTIASSNFDVPTFFIKQKKLLQNLEQLFLISKNQ